MITAKVILDSISPIGDRLTTIEVNIHRFILAELNTHRVFSRSAQSSRAIPVKTMIARVLEDPALPIEWGKNTRYMQAKEVLSEADAIKAEAIWLDAAQYAAKSAAELVSLGLHKQLVNRLLEPFMWQRVIISSTSWSNFFHLRAHPDAQPEFRDAAYAMQKAYNESTPRKLSYGDWHTPYIRPDEDFDLATRKRISVARCARVSYLTNNGVRDPEKDSELFNRLIEEKPVHSAPSEHVATPCLDNRLGNFEGWLQYRHIIEGKAYAK